MMVVIILAMKALREYEGRFMKGQEAVAPRPLWRLEPRVQPRSQNRFRRIFGIQRTEPRPRADVCSPYGARDGERAAMHVMGVQWLVRRAGDDEFWLIAPHLYTP